MFSRISNDQATKATIASQTVATPQAAAAGDTVTVDIAFTDAWGNGQLPAAYAVAAVPSQAAFVTVSAKTATVQLAAGTVDVSVVGTRRRACSRRSTDSHAAGAWQPFLFDASEGFLQHETVRRTTPHDRLF